MSELVDSLQMTIKNTVKAMDLLDSGFATVLSPSPVTLRIQASKLTVTEPVVIISDNVRYKAVSVQGETVILNPGLKAGDKVLYLKANSGQNYIVIAKV